MLNWVDELMGKISRDERSAHVLIIIYDYVKYSTVGLCATFGFPEENLTCPCVLGAIMLFGSHCI